MNSANKKPASNEIELETIGTNNSQTLNPIAQSTSNDSSYFFGLYWQFMQNSRFQKETAIIDIYKSCQNLITAALMGNHEAKTEIRMPYQSFLAHEFQNIVDNEFITRLEELAKTSAYFYHAKNSLFILYYVKKYRSNYTNYIERYKEIFEALTHLNQADSFLDPNLSQFAKVLDCQFPQSYEALKLNTWKILALELMGKDPLLEATATTQKSTDLKSSYPFRILPKHTLIEILTQAFPNQPDMLHTFTQQYAEHIKSKAIIIPCSKGTNGKYQINLSPEQLKQIEGKVICFADNTGEIARVELSGNSIHFKGHGDNIELNIKDGLNCPSLIMENIDGEIELNTDFNMDQALYISANTNKLTYTGEINSNHIVRLDTNSTVKITNTAKILSDNEIHIRANSLIIDGEIHAENTLQMDIKKDINVSSKGRMNSQKDIILSAGSLKNILGKISAYERVLINTSDSIYLHGAASIKGKEAVIINAKSLISTDKSSINSEKLAQITAQDKLFLYKETEWKAATLQLKANDISNYSPNIKADKISIHANKAFRNHPSGLLTAEENILLGGSSAWNGGKLKAKKSIVAQLNKLFVHGVSTLNSEELRSAVANSSMEADDINIVSGIFFGALGSAHARNKTITAIAEIGADLSLTKYNRKSRLISLACSIDLPNIPIIYQDLREFSTKIEQGKYTEALQSIVSWQSASGAVSVARWIIRILFPGAGKIADLGWSCLMLIMSTPNLYKQCVALYEKSQNGVEVQPYELYKLIATASGIGIQAFNLDTQLETDLTTGFGGGFSESNLTGDIPGLATSFASLFLPTNTDDSIVGISAGGINSNGSLIRRNVWSYEAWHTELALNSTHNFQNSTQDHQITLANNVSNIGGSLTRSGVELANNDYTNVATQNESSNILAKKVIWQTENLNENANVHADIIQASASDTFSHHGVLSGSQLVSLTGHNITTDKQSQLNGDTVLMTANTILHQGDSTSKQTIINAENTAELTKTSHNTTEKFILSGTDVTQDGSISIIQTPVTHASVTITKLPNSTKSSAASDEQKNNDTEDKSTENKNTPPINPQVYIHARNQTTLGENSKINAAGSAVLVSGNSTTDAGETNADNFILAATETLTLTDTSTSNINKLCATAKDIDQNSKINISKSQEMSIEVKPIDSKTNDTPTDKPEPAIIFKAENTIHMGTNSNIDATGNAIYAQGNNIKDEGCTQAAELDLIGTETVELSESAVSEAQKIFISAKNIAQKSTINITNSPHTNIIVKPISETESKKPDEDKQDTPDLVFNASENLTIDASSHIQGKNATAYYKAAKIHDDGTQNVNHLIEKASDDLDIGKAQHTTAESITYDSDKTVELSGHTQINKTIQPAVPSEKPNEDKSAENKPDEEKTTLNPDFFIHGQTVTATEDCQTEADHATVVVSGNNISDSSNTHAETLIEMAKEHLEVTVGANHTADTVSYQANNATLNGTPHAKLIDIHINHGLDVNAILSKSDSGKNINPSETLSIETEDSINLNQNYEFNINVSLTAENITIDKKTVHSTKSLEFNSTKGDISVTQSELKADETLSMNSAHKLNNDHSKETAKIANIHAQEDITNIASSIHASTYLQVKSDHGDIKNIGAEEKDVNNKPIYTSSEMVGGNGIGYDGVGTFIEAEHKLINTGSIIDSGSGLYATGKSGVENTAYTYRYTPPVAHLKNHLLYPFAYDTTLAQKITHQPEVVTISSKLGGLGTVIIHSDADILNSQSYLNGNELLLQAKGSIYNQAGLIAATTYLEMIAGRSIENQCIISNIQGEFDTLRKYDIGHICGGTGIGHDNLGLLMQAEDQIINHASEISSMGSNYISGKHGITSNAEYHQYISYYRHTKSWYGKETTTIDKSFQIQPGLIYSANGSNTLVSELGGINSLSTNFVAGTDNNFSAHDSIKLLGLVLKESEYKDKSNAWGLSRTRTNQSDDFAVPTVISNPGNTHIISLEDVDMPNTSINIGGKLSIEAKNISFSAPILNHSFTTDSRGFSINSPLLHLTNPSPLLDDYRALSHSQNSAEWLANSWNMGFDALNSTNSIIAGIRNQSLTESLFPASYLTSVDINYTHTKTSNTWQTVAANVGVKCGELSLNASNKVEFNNGVAIYVSGNGSIHAKTFNQSGAKLHSTSSSSSQTISTGLSLETDVNVGASISGNVSKSTYYANQIFNVNGMLSIDVDECNLSDANLFAGSLHIHTDTLSIISHLNTSSSHAWSVSGNTNGGYSLQNSDNESGLIGRPSGILVKDTTDLTARHAYFEGAKIVTGENTNIVFETVEAKSVEEYSHGSSVGISGNTHDLGHLQTTPQWQPSLPSVAVSVGYRDYEAKQTSTVYTPNKSGLHIGNIIGQLNTENNSGLTIERDDKFNILVKVPIFNSAGIKQIEENLNWAGHKLFYNKPNISAYKNNSSNNSELDQTKKSRHKRWTADKSKPNVVNKILESLPSKNESIQSDYFGNEGTFEKLIMLGVQTFAIIEGGAEISAAIRLYQAGKLLQSDPIIGDTVYRIWGDGANSYGRSWTRTNPSNIQNYRDVAGLPNENTARFISEGRLNSTTGIQQRTAIPLHGNKGGLDELIIPNPKDQIDLVSVLGINK